ncbi:hypothetical protein VZC42_06665 [Raoultella ornithinolytica]|uniref:hypothetical protein n=1 Tax=Raoultella ornithinolytica TaxID=54291 RepID=UPI0038A28225
MSELTAALATIEKCREITGCPAGLDLQDHLRQLAAENVGLKAAINAVNRTAEECEVNGDELKYVVEPSEFEALIDLLDETPATDRIYAGIKADGLPANIAEIIDSGDLETICYESERSYAEDFRLALYNFRQLREGAK